MKEKIQLSNSNFTNFSFENYSRIFHGLKVIDFVSRFETDLEEYLDKDKSVVALNSGTSAIHLALVLSGVKSGDTVICQTATFSASAFPIIYQKAVPVFIDSEEETSNMCPHLLEKIIVKQISNGKKPKAIIVVHLYGMPAKIDEISNIAKKYEIVLIEDAAEALGSTYKGQKCGTFGDFGILSFNKNKIITAFGGGALVCKNIENKQKAIFLASQARDNAPHYQHSVVGYNYRISNLLAGIGKWQMGVLDEYIALRRMNNEFYQELFKDIDGVTVFVEPTNNYYSNHWLSCIKIQEEISGFNREDLRLQMLKDNIESRPLWKPMHLQPVFKDYDYHGGNVAEILFKNGLCLPSGSDLRNDERFRISSSIKKILK